MNWKTIRQLISVDMKAGRLTRGQRLTNYNVKRSRLYSYLTYAATISIGLAIGIIVSYFYSTNSSDRVFRVIFDAGFASFQYSLPTIVLVFALIFTMMQQIQRSGARATNQAPYWLPITWLEHTCASILADLLGIPLLAVALISPAVLVVSVLVGQVPLAVGAILAMIAAAFIAVATIEIFRIIQLRFTGAVYKSTGKAAVWVRFASSIGLFVIFYILYFFITSGSGFVVFVQTIASVQSSAWFVPFVWPGMALFTLLNGLLFEGVAFLGLSILFIVGLVYIGTALNSRFGLYEPPAITISRGGYVPKTGLLGKFGFTTVEAALIRKDLKAFTRRRELMSTFILPIVFLILPIMSSLNNPASQGAARELPSFMFAISSIFPTVLMAMSLGNFMTGEEGQGVWRIFASPISAKAFVKSKYAFMLFFSLIVLPITGSVGYLIYQPSINTAIALVTESVFVAFAAGALSLANGIKGADFNELPKPRMIRAEWSLINMVTCFAAALAVMVPLVPYVISVFTGSPVSFLLGLYPSLAISGVIAVVLTFLFYKMAIGNAKELLTKAEM